jgi:hypothetical protein
MKDFLPTVLTTNDRANLGSVQKHPGFQVLLEKIMKGHAQQALYQIHDVPLDDPNRTAQLDAICSVAYAMQKSLDLVLRELKRNWEILEQEEANSRKEPQ